MKLWRKLGIILFWIVLWELFAGLVNNSFLLVGPIESIRALGRLMEEKEFYAILWKSSKGFLSAYFLSFFLALFFSYFSYRFTILEDFLKPGVFVLRSLPVASLSLSFYSFWDELGYPLPLAVLCPFRFFILIFWRAFGKRIGIYWK